MRKLLAVEWTILRKILDQELIILSSLRENFTSDNGARTRWACADMRFHQEKECDCD